MAVLKHEMQLLPYRGRSGVTHCLKNLQLSPLWPKQKNESVVDYLNRTKKINAYQTLRISNAPSICEPVLRDMTIIIAVFFPLDPCHYAKGDILITCQSPEASLVLLLDAGKIILHLPLCSIIILQLILKLSH